MFRKNNDSDQADMKQNPIPADFSSSTLVYIGVEEEREGKAAITLPK